MKNQSLNYCLLEQFKPSKYNISVQFEDNRGGMLYNSFTGAKINLSSALLNARQLKALEMDYWPEEVELPKAPVCEFLSEYGFIVPKDYNEIAKLEALNREYSDNPAIRRITVILTKKCNLSCIYCYQHKNIACRDFPVNNKLKDFLLSQVIPGGQLAITWFGGEPLLRVDVIKELSDFLITECDKNNTTYFSTISTNGFLLDEKTITTLKQCRVSIYQITLDGPLPIHESRRPAKNGRPTFTTIISNIKLLLKAEADVRIKVIIDKENYEYLPVLFDDLKNNSLLGDVRIAIQQTEAKFAAEEYGNRIRDSEEFSAIKTDLLSELAKRGYVLNEPSRTPEFCAANSAYCTVIDMKGNTYRCGTEDENRTGFISKKGKIVTTNAEYEAIFLEKPYLKSDLCHTCKVLPLCGGGCSLAFSNGADRDCCSFFRYAIRDYLLLLDKYSRSNTKGGGEFGNE